jgi:hypothetical protein
VSNIPSILTLGLGSWGSVAFVVTLGYGAYSVATDTTFFPAFSVGWGWA